MRKRYYVDWDDRFYPKIRDVKFATQSEAPMTFTEAKMEIIRHFTEQKNFANIMIARTRALREKDVVVS